MIRNINETPYFNLGSYIQYQINESKQYALFESIDSDYDLQNEWEETKEIILDLWNNGAIVAVNGAAKLGTGSYYFGKGSISAGINAYNKKSTDTDIQDIKHGAKDLWSGTKNTASGIANITTDVFKLLYKLGKAVVAAIKYLHKTLSKQETKDKVKKIIQSFKNALLIVIKRLKKVTAKQVIILMIGTGMAAGVVYNIQNKESIYKEYKQLIEQKDINSVSNVHTIKNNQAFGIDISKYQDGMTGADWDVINDNCDFVIIKGAGAHTMDYDPMFTTHLNNARQKNLNIGIYFFYLNNKSVEEQFKLFCQMIDKAGGMSQIDIKPILDIENGSVRTKNQVFDKNYQDNIRKFIELYKEKYNDVPLIYTGANHLQDYKLLFLIDEYNCPIWTAHYGADGKGTIYKGKTIDKKKQVFMETKYGAEIGRGVAMLQYSETGDHQIKLKNSGVDVDACWDWNTIKN